MCVCVYVYMCVCVYVCMCVCVYVCMCVCVYVYMYICIYLCRQGKVTHVRRSRSKRKPKKYNHRSSSEISRAVIVPMVSPASSRSKKNVPSNLKDSIDRLIWTSPSKSPSYSNVCMSVCICLCMYVCMYVCIYACMCLCACICICMYVYYPCINPQSKEKAKEAQA